MAVEARSLNLGTMMNPIEANVIMNQADMVFGVPLSGTTTTEGLLPLCNSLVNDSIFYQKAAPPPAAAAAAGAMKSGSTLMYNDNILPLSRKRSRDSIDPILSFSSPPQQPRTNNSFARDISLRMEQQQFDIDHLISQHMERIRVEMEEKNKWQTRKIMEAIEGGVLKKLRVKEDEIEKIGKLNWALQDRVKSLSIENQIWRELAQTNEATANALRINLAQVVAAAVQAKDERTCGVRLEDDDVVVAGDEVDDAQSGCGSSWEVEKRTLVEDAAVEGEGCGDGRLCRSCGKAESCVLLLPCRHLFLCTICGSAIHICPVCKSTKNASVHVNMS